LKNKHTTVSYPVSYTVTAQSVRVGQEVDPSMDWIGLDWVRMLRKLCGLDWVRWLQSSVFFLHLYIFYI